MGRVVPVEVIMVPLLRGLRDGAVQVVFAAVMRGKCTCIQAMD